MVLQVNDAVPFREPIEIEDVADETEVFLGEYFERRLRQDIHTDDAISLDDLQVSQEGSEGGVESEPSSLGSSVSFLPEFERSK